MKNIITAIVISVILISLALIFTSGNNKKEITKSKTPVNNVTIVDGIQIVTIEAKGGYQPRSSIAKANIPTILRFNTKGNFDCSSAVRIPSMNISKNLPQSGVTDIDLGNQKVGLLNGSCGMGMYPFEIKFID